MNRYSTGEEPRAGDLIRSLKGKYGQRAVGEVFEVRKLSPYGDVYYNAYTHGDPHTFELVARAGEPVTYLPSDVVELIDVPGAVMPSSGYKSRLPGYRYTLCDPAYAPNGVGSLHYVDTYNGGDKTWAPPSYFKLVHRPDPVKAEPQTGDRVRVTFEGVVRHRYADDPGNVPGDRGLMVCPDGMDTAALFSDTAVRDAGFRIETIARPEPPLAVGDRVAAEYTSRRTAYHIESMSETKLCVRDSKHGEIHIVERSAWKRFRP